TLYDTVTRNTTPRMMNNSRIGHRIPRYLPRINCRRLTGFDSKVSAVRPSISSATEVLAVHSAMMMASTLIVVMPDDLSIFTSSPNVLYGVKTNAMSATTPMAINMPNKGWATVSFAVEKAMTDVRGDSA